jgi:hypothetical protein
MRGLMTTPSALLRDVSVDRMHTIRQEARPNVALETDVR